MRHINLGKGLEISDLHPLFEELEDCLKNKTDVEFDGAELDYVDAGSVQLLAAFCQEAKRKSLKVKWKEVSRHFKQDVALLGMEEPLGITSE